jgi:hypothetical protein
MNLFTKRQQQYSPYYFIVGGYGYSTTSVALNSAYVFNSSGGAYFQPFEFAEDGTITDVWVAVTRYSGTWSLTDKKILVEIRYHVDSTNIPGDLVTNGSLEVDLSSSPTGWVKASFPGGSLPSVDSDTPMVVVVGDPDGGATNYVTMTCAMRSASPASHTPYSTTDGFRSSPTAVSYPSPLCVKHAGVMYGGSLWLGSSNTTSNTRKRGFILTPDRDIAICGVTTAANREWRVYGNDQLPNDTPLYTWTANANYVGEFTDRWFPTEYTLKANTTYKVVFVPSVNTSFGYFPTLANADSDIYSLFPFNGNCGWIEQVNGSNSWAAPDYTKVPAGQLICYCPKTETAFGYAV